MRGLFDWLNQRAKIAQVQLTKGILDCAEALPVFQGGPIARLQRFRKRQREWSVKAYERSRPPDGTSIELCHLRLLELFPIEEFDRLEQGLTRLFGPSGWDSRSHLRDFSRSAPSLSGGMMVNVGTVRRSRSQWNPVDSWAVLELPPEVSTVQISVHKILPSIFVVAADVFLEKSAASHLQFLQQQQYLSEFSLKPLLPLKERFWTSENNPAREAEKTLLAWLDELRSRIEMCVNPYVRGYFQSHRDLAMRVARQSRVTAS